MALVCIHPHYAGVVDADVDAIWEIVRLWCPSNWLHSIKESPVSFQLLAGDSGEQVGARRAVYIGHACLIEKLVAMDAQEHYQSWKCINPLPGEPQQVNPFPGSFVNYNNTIRFTAMTNGKTQANWQGELFTDKEHAKGMEELLSDFYRHSLESLEERINQERRPKIKPPPINDYPKDPATMRTLSNAFGKDFR